MSCCPPTKKSAALILAVGTGVIVCVSLPILVTVTAAGFAIPGITGWQWALIVAAVAGIAFSLKRFICKCGAKSASEGATACDTERCR